MRECADASYVSCRRRETPEQEHRVLGILGSNRFGNRTETWLIGDDGRGGGTNNNQNGQVGGMEKKSRERGKDGWTVVV